MNIVDHRLTAHWHALSADVGAPLIEPRFLIVHYTAQGAGADTRDWMLLAPEEKQRLAGVDAPLHASAHVVLDRDGSLWQIAPFDRQTRHAGVSEWRGLTRLNQYAIGIELANYGWLDRLEDGGFGRGDTPRFDASDVVIATMPHGTEEKGWEPFAEPQLAALERLVRSLLRTYPGIAEILGHQEVSPGRKFDPGPAFPMTRFRALLADRGAGAGPARGP